MTSPEQETCPACGSCYAPLRCWFDWDDPHSACMDDWHDFYYNQHKAESDQQIAELKRMMGES